MPGLGQALVGLGGGDGNDRIGFDLDSSIVVPVNFSGERTVVPGVAGLTAPAFIWPNDGDYGYGLFLPGRKVLPANRTGSGVLVRCRCRTATRRQRNSNAASASLVTSDCDIPPLQPTSSYSPLMLSLL